MRRSARSVAALAAAAALSFVPARPAPAQDATTPSEAIEKARALEREGFPEDAALYLRDLIIEPSPLAEDAEVLLELARLTPDAEVALEYVDRALAISRDAGVIVRAHRMRGDFLFIEGRYAEAATEYEQGARHAGGASAYALELRRAASLLASEDASRAADAYRTLAERSDAPEDARPWAELGLARALLARGDLEGATIEFERVVEAFPGHGVRPHALAGEIECYVAAGSDSAARAALSLLEANYPTSYEAVLARDLIETSAAAQDTASPVREEAGDGTESN